MNRWSLTVVLLSTFTATGLSAQGSVAADPNLGTWRLNIARSSYSPGPAPKSEIATFQRVGSDVKLTVDRIEADGRRVHIEWIGRFDGKEYPSQGDVTSDMRSYRRIDDYTYALINKKDGTIVRTGTTVYSRDGKTRTNTMSGTNAVGQKINNLQVYDRQ